LVLVVVVAAVATSLRPPAQLDPNTPEGTVQAYLLALRDKDWEKAHSLLSADLRDECRVEDLVNIAETPSRAVIEEVTAAGSVTNVSVRITEVYYDDPLTPSAYDLTVDYVLRQEEGRWALTEVGWPYFYCEER
jgi:hypothetical protein